MDLDDFEVAIAQSPLEDGPPEVSSQSAKDAVEYIDAQWYTFVNRRGRWMDLIGDYAGSEPFVVDGKLSLLSRTPRLVLMIVLFQARLSSTWF